MQSILIVEDEKRVADLLKTGLEENGYRVTVAYDGARKAQRQKALLKHTK